MVTAQAFRRFLVETGIEDAIFRKLERLDVDDNDALESVSREVQDLVLSAEIPDYIKEDIVDAYAQMGANEVVVAVRSSATAEDLPEASFAGQQETFLNVLGNDDLLDAVQRCWASLYGARAIYYRAKQGFDDRGVNIAVVVQELIRSEKSGVMFTSHPVTGEPLTIIEASWGLGEAVVSGSVSPDNYVFDLRSGRVVDRLIAEKEIMIVPEGDDGTKVVKLSSEKRTAPVLTDAEVARLATLGKIVEDHYGIPQDVEWAIVGDEIFILQSRPITTIRRPEIPRPGAEPAPEAESALGVVLLEGQGASPG